MYFYHLSPNPFMDSTINGKHETKLHDNNLQTIMFSELEL